MKIVMKILKTVLVLGAIGIIGSGCVVFNTAYERVDSDATRLLSVQYDPVEARPGDTVRVMCIFAGAPVSFGDIDWTVSYKVMSNNYGFDTAIEIHSLADDGIIPIDTQFSPSTHTVAFKMRVPSDIMFQSPQIPENWSSVFEGAGINLPPELSSQLTKSELLSIMDLVAAIPPEIAAPVLDSLQLNDTLIALAAQFLTVKMRMFGEVNNGRMNIVATYPVRYSNALSQMPGMPIHKNDNPSIDSAGIYKVSGLALSAFDPNVNSQSYEFIKMYDAKSPLIDTPGVKIDKNYSYFVASFSGPSDTINSLSALTDPVSASVALEKSGFQWFFQIDTSEAGSVKWDKLPAFTNYGMFSSWTAPITPAKDKRVANVLFWVQIYDQISIEEAFRSQGCSLHEMRCRFEYTQSYLDYVNK